MGKDESERTLTFECDEVEGALVGEKSPSFVGRQSSLGGEIGHDRLVAGHQSANCQVSSTALRNFAGALSQ